MKQHFFAFLLMTSIFCISSICAVNGKSSPQLYSATDNDCGKMIVPLYVMASYDITTKGNSMPKSPIAPRMIEVGNSSMSLGGKFNDASVEILHNGNIVYSQFVPQDTDTIELPFEFISGDYEIVVNEGQTKYVGHLYI